MSDKSSALSSTNRGRKTRRPTGAACIPSPEQFAAMRDPKPLLENLRIAADAAVLRKICIEAFVTGGVGIAIFPSRVSRNNEGPLHPAAIEQVVNEFKAKKWHVLLTGKGRQRRLIIVNDPTLV